MGELRFEPHESDGNVESSQIANMDIAGIVAELLGTSKYAIEQACCNKTLRACGEDITKPLSFNAASENRHALAKALYSSMFHWMCARINGVLSVQVSSKVHGTIGILDIFGFENFEHNSFEQLCINYANEMLQQKFNKDAFKTVQAEYEKESLTCEKIDFQDNQNILDLIEGKMGIIAMMNDHLQRPRGTEDAFVNRLKRLYKDAPKEISFGKIDRTKFTIHHYAGPVIYEAVGFMEKHEDSLMINLVQLMKNSSIPLVQDIFKIDHMSKSNTVGSKFKKSLNDLKKQIDLTNVQYIRCIKPNAKKIPNEFDKTMVLEQLRSSGVIDAMRVSRYGYPSRMTPKEFLENFKLVLPPSMMQGGDSKAQCYNLMEKIGKRSPIDFQIGTNLIFFKGGVLEELESMKLDFLHHEATIIIKFFRKLLQRNKYLALRKTVVRKKRIRSRNVVVVVVHQLLEYNQKLIRNSMSILVPFMNCGKKFQSFSSAAIRAVGSILKKDKELIPCMEVEELFRRHEDLCQRVMNLEDSRRDGLLGDLV